MGLYAIELVNAAVQIALKRRGFSYPSSSADRSRDSVTARTLAFDAIFSLTGNSVTGTAVSLGASTASGKSLRERTETYASPDDRILWIAEVRSLVEESMKVKK
jgi:hypothetical protein